MQLSVIIPCYNAADTIATQLDALASQCWSQPWEIIVVNNRCTDESMAIVERYQKKLANLRIVDASARQGQPYALNTGAQAALGTSIAFCDADDAVGPGWVAAMGEALSQHEFVAARLDIEELNPPWVQATHVNPQRDSLQRIGYPPYLPHAGGGSLGVRRLLHEAVGGFDESLPYLHDTDYCFKLQLAGVKFHFVPNAVVHIRYRDKLGGAFRQARHWAEYSMRVYKKYSLSTGMTVSQPWRRHLRHWKQLLRGLPQLRRRGGRFAWVWQLGWLTGKLQGSIKCRLGPF